ncbi:hypothetical protein K2173_012997 [Erythroxylum novogranatense]|uniref:Uncharacterized protein n=1 Tax=Erythroxylum novogranatense TaxID=1862640 RepID=A0AAV8S652_9ROSI|nr:hypothetical protein K2173_012997 [Erythroxylum novogranatense]
MERNALHCFASVEYDLGVTSLFLYLEELVFCISMGAAYTRSSQEIEEEELKFNSYYAKLTVERTHK